MRNHVQTLWVGGGPPGCRRAFGQGLADEDADWARRIARTVGERRHASPRQRNVVDRIYARFKGRVPPPVTERRRASDYCYEIRDMSSSFEPHEPPTDAELHRRIGPTQLYDDETSGPHNLQRHSSFPLGRTFGRIAL